MSTAPQVLDNRANARLSTGPQTEPGKTRSSQNSLRHGLASGRIIIPGENPGAFDALLADLVADHKPGTPTEQLLVEQMAQNFWLAQRAIRLQQDAFVENRGELPAKLHLLIRYQSTNERAFHKALDTLSKLQKARAQTEVGFVSLEEQVKDPEPEQERGQSPSAFLLEFRPPQMAPETSSTSTG